MAKLSTLKSIRETELEDRIRKVTSSYRKSGDPSKLSNEEMAEAERLGLIVPHSAKPFGHNHSHFKP